MKKGIVVIAIIVVIAVVAGIFLMSNANHATTVRNNTNSESSDYFPSQSSSLESDAQVFDEMDNALQGIE